MISIKLVSNIFLQEYVLVNAFSISISYGLQDEASSCVKRNQSVFYHSKIWLINDYVLVNELPLENFVHEYNFLL